MICVPGFIIDLNMEKHVTLWFFLPFHWPFTKLWLLACTEFLESNASLAEQVTHVFSSVQETGMGYCKDTLQ